MDLQETLHEISNYIKVLDEVKNELEQKKAQIVSLRTGCLVARSTGAAVGTVGTVISIIGFIGAPLTGGLSLAAMVGGMAAGLTGGATTGIAEGVQHFKNQAFIEEVTKLQARVEEADRRYEGLFNSPITRGIHRRVSDEAKAEAPSPATFTAKAIEVPFVFLLKAASRAQRQIGKAMKTGQATKAAFTAANATRRTLKMATRSIIVVDVIFTTWEFASIIKDWNTRDPTQEDIDELIEQLQEKMDEAEEVMRDLQADLSNTLAIGDNN